MRVNWNTILDRLKKDDESKSDSLVWATEVRVEEGHLIVPTRYIKPFKSDFRNGDEAGSVVLPTFENGDVRLSVSDRALTQMAGRLSIPPKYLKRKYKEGAWNVVDPVIRDDLERHGDRLLLRLRGTSIRAVLSRKYTRINNTDIIQDVIDLVAEKANVRSFHIDGDGIWVKALFDGLSFVAADGQEMHVGIMFGNSEVGSRSVTIEPFIYRQSCTNDLVVAQEDAFRHRHIYIDRAQLRMGVRKALASAVRVGDQVVDQIEEACREEIEDPIAVIEKMAKKARYSQKFTDEVRSAWQEERASTKWGVVNAFTQAAQTLEGDRRVEVERMAGTLLVAPDITRAKVTPTPTA